MSATSPRARMVAAMATALLDALEAGDLDAARIAHDAIGRLLREDPGNDSADVVDLAARRPPRK
ncbi:MAG: hypothetical protein K1X94_11210 [Sandaracinaceae bacterium]|nr:hypothetical protein [Sandaracinaceae bacterium]